MQKNRKRFEGSTVETRHRHEISGIVLPDVANMDDLAVMLDEDLIVRLRELEDDKSRAYDAHVDVRPWEVELAYIRREQQIRRNRRDAYAEYVRLLNEEEQNEYLLPQGDFDNSAYVYAATGGRPRRN